ncbi:MAG TPA: NADH-quinone oxidoreductase subunit L [Myxococcales bacterium]|nr:NADH-quinone oxidoreductase subunit L [Myxococcales bacterium]
MHDPSALVWIPLLPLLGALVCGLFGPRLGRANVNLVACAAVAGAFALALLAFVSVAGGPAITWAATWFAVGRIHIGAGLLVDRLSGLLLLVVTGIGFLIHVYSTGYMADDPGHWRYFAYLNLFVGSMLILVLADNLVLLFVGWEGVGLCSYLLIGFWYDDAAKASAGRKAFVVNRIGDFGFGLAVFALLALFGTVEFRSIAAELARAAPAEMLNQGLFAGWHLSAALTLIALLFVLGVTGKSAQIPLYVWLPDAMAGPTPVSALIHAATMVTAGVYLMCRLSFLFAFAPAALTVVACIGAATAIFAAAIAFAQNDIKKVLAYSTVSQLGYMVLAVGVGAFWAAIFHLITHACFKALLFLGSGSVIHGLGGEQDMRQMGGLGRRLRHTAIAFGVATVAITGVLPISGFFSKDAILGAALGSENRFAPWLPAALYGVGLAAALGTAFYMWRLWALTFAGQPRSPAAEHAHESPASMTVPDDVLAFLSIVTLALGLPLMGHEPFLKTFLDPIFGAATNTLLTSAVAPASELGTPWALYAVAIAVAWAGYALAYWLYQGGARGVPARLAAAFPPGYRLIANKFYVDEIYQAVIVKPLWGLARTLWRLLDQGLIDLVIVRGSAWVVATISAYVLKPLQNGDVQRYAAVMAIGATALLWWVLR